MHSCHRPHLGEGTLTTCSYFLEVGETGQETIPEACAEVRQGSGDVHSSFLSCSAGSSHIPGQGPQRQDLQHWIPGF